VDGTDALPAPFALQRREQVPLTVHSNAVAESFFATLQTELLDRHHWPTRDSLRLAIFEFIEVFYNRRRRHEHLGQVSPDIYEKRWYEQQAQAQVTSP